MSVNNRGKKILLVDDDQALRTVLAEQLDLYDGFTTIQVGTAAEGLERAKLAHYDAILLDIHLPTMSGLSLYLAILARWPALTGRIAIMTGDAEAEEVSAWLERNPCPLIRKPFDLRQVAAWIASVLRWQGERAGNG